MNTIKVIWPGANIHVISLIIILSTQEGIFVCHLPLKDKKKKKKMDAM